MKLASLVLVVGSLLLADGLLADGVSAQEAVYAAPAGEPVRERSGSTLKDTGDHVRPMTASAQAYIPWLRGIGIGVRFGFEVPIVPKGFISKLNDSISLEPIFSIGYTNYYSCTDCNTTNYLAGVGGLWSFWLKENLRVYGAVNLGVNIYSFHYDNGFGGRHRNNDVDPYVELAGGVFWRFAEKFALRGEVGWYGPRGGIALLL